MKGKGEGEWSGWLDDYFVAKLNKAKTEIPNFNTNLTGILFGKGKTFITMFKDGFTAELDDEEIPSDAEEHPLRKVCPSETASNGSLRHVTGAAAILRRVVYRPRLNAVLLRFQIFLHQVQTTQ